MKSPIWRTQPEQDHQNDVFIFMQKAVVGFCVLVLVLMCVTRPNFSDLPFYHPKTMAAITLALNIVIMIRRLARSKSQRLP